MKHVFIHLLHLLLFLFLLPDDIAVPDHSSGLYNITDSVDVM